MLPGGQGRAGLLGQPQGWPRLHQRDAGQPLELGRTVRRSAQGHQQDQHQARRPDRRRRPLRSVVLWHLAARGRVDGPAAAPVDDPRVESH